jgi:septal ring factor EnvC (AmiA/AmiB activator)
MEFSLFDKEKKIVEQAEKLIAKQECDPEEIRDFLAVFIDAFRRCYQEQKCLIRISDRLQEQLLETKKELLIKTDQLKRQAKDLKALNENFASEIAARKRIEEKLRIMANRDALTKVYNRRRFLEFLVFSFMLPEIRDSISDSLYLRCPPKVLYAVSLPSLSHL